MADAPERYGGDGGPGKSWEGLLALLRSLDHMTVALSGGIDSRFLTHAAQRAGVPLSLVHVSGPHVAAAETAYALAWAAGLGLEVRVLELDPLGLPEVASGSRERCYACKTLLFREILRVAKGVVCDGSNISDAGQFRPGMRALRELGVRSPLAEAGLGKDDIRDLAGRTGLAWPGQQSRACLLTRLPYGVPPRAELLDRLADGEAGVEDVLRQAGYGDASFRLRALEGGVMELHLGLASLSDELRELLTVSLRNTGFASTRIRCMSDISGYYDRVKSF